MFKSRRVNLKGKSNTQLAASGTLLLEPEYQVKHVPTQHRPMTAQWNRHTSETSTAAVFLTHNEGPLHRKIVFVAESSQVLEFLNTSRGFNVTSLF